MTNMMKYTYLVGGVEQTAMVDMNVVRKIRKSLGLSVKEASLMYINEGMADMSDAEVAAKLNSVNPAAVEKPKRKAPARKVDVEKKTIIASLYEYLVGGQVSDALNAEQCGKVDAVVIENDQRLIRFTIGNDTYDLTLAKKRAPKA